MKIFPAKTEVQSASAKPEKSTKEAKIARKKAELPAKKEISGAEIKEKLAAHVGVSDAAKNMAVASQSKKFGEAFMNPDAIAKAATEVVSVQAPVVEEEIKTPNTKDLILKSDIAANDPKDTNTQEKLKTALVKGAFNFSPKERDALEKILGN
jgi:hypothetical protein